MKYLVIVCLACLLAYSQQKPMGKASVGIDTTDIDSTYIQDSLAIVEMQENMKILMKSQGLKYQKKERK
jgi:hypothetical protein